MSHEIPLGLAYLATPYRNFPGGLLDAFVAAAQLSARLTLAGVRIYSPIVHGHAIAIWGDNCDVDPRDMSIWEPHNHAMMAVCDVLIVAHLPSWEESEGIRLEVLNYERLGRPIWDCDPDSLTMIKRPPREVVIGEGRAALDAIAADRAAKRAREALR